MTTRDVLESQGSGGASSRSVEVACCACQKANPGDRKYCGHCGASLWEPCTECGELHPSDEAYCGGCGVHLPEVLERRVSAMKACLAEARQKGECCEFDEAIRLLKTLNAAPHSRLRELLGEAQQLTERFADEQERRTGEAEAALGAAESFVAAGRYEDARCALEAVPPALRDEPCRDLLKQVSAACEEKTTLEFDIRRAVEKGKTNGLLPKVRRLVDLKPHDNQLRALHRQLEERNRDDEKTLGQRLAVKASKKLAEYEYESAVELLRRIGDAACTDEVEKLKLKAEELLYLRNAIRTAPLVDDALIAIVKRLMKVSPGDKKATQYFRTMQERREAAAAKSPHKVPQWAASPKRTPVGPPVDCLPAFPKIICRLPEMAATLARHPGRFAVAIGLALQGLGRGRLNLNLLPSPKKGLLSRLVRRSNKQSAPAAWGIDLSVSALKAVKLMVTADEAGVEVAESTVIPHQKLLGRCESDEQRRELIQATLAKFISQRAPADERICVGLPGPRVIGRLLTVPPVSPKKFDQVVQYEARQQIPLPLETTVWDYQALAEPETEDELAMVGDIVLAAVQQIHAHEHIEPFLKAELKVDLLQCDWIALYNFLVHEFFDTSLEDSKADAAPKAIALVDVGHEAMNIVVGSPDRLWYRSVGEGADELTKLLTREFKLTYDRAEQLKQQPTLAKRLGHVNQTQLPALERLTKIVGQSLDTFANSHRNHRVEHVYVVGGGMQSHGLVRHLRFGV